MSSSPLDASNSCARSRKWLALFSWRAATEPIGQATEGSLDDGPRFAGDGIEGRRITPVQH
jgi:hypothetical protein